jgi:hypothetical protein
MVRAARLDASLYSEVDADPSATGQAVTVIVLVAVATGIGAAIAGAQSGVGAGIIALLVEIVTSLLGWLIWSLTVYLVGRGPAEGRVTYGGVVRALGFASSPGVLQILAFLPGIGLIVLVIVSLWRGIAGVVAVRESLGLDTGMAIITIVVAWILQFLVLLFLSPFLLAIFGIASLR